MPAKCKIIFLKVVSHFNHFAILDILWDGKQCVCHIEAILNLRQAYISQQLMVLKQANLVESWRDGLNLYYRVTKPEIFKVMDTIRSVTGVTPKPFKHKHANTDCPCPKCAEQELIKL